ncbi:MAG: hypothetical protein EBR10_08425 [Planctomycetes bacterium]|nr:hypothetical protein [Planctomycetota bacterium]
MRPRALRASVAHLLIGCVSVVGSNAFPQVPTAPQSTHLPQTQRVVARETQPVAVRGGVLMVPLALQEGGGVWPAAVTIRMQDGRTINGRTASIEPRTGQGIGWTGIRSGAGTTAPESNKPVVLLAPLPSDGDGPMWIGDQRLDPLWLEPWRAPERATPELSLRVDDLPDGSLPDQYFRTALMSQWFGSEVPEWVGGDVDRLYARAIAGLWSAAIARLAENEPHLAEVVIASLSGRCHGVVEGQDATLGGWETRAERLDELLRALLDPRASGLVLAEGARLWLDARTAPLCWLEHDDGERVHICVANPRGEPLPIAFRWPNIRTPSLEAEVSPESFQTFVVPREQMEAEPLTLIDPSLREAIEAHGLAALLPPGERSGASGGRTSMEQQVRSLPVLLVESAQATTLLQVGFGRVAARPPGIDFGALLPAVSLDEIRAGTSAPLPMEWLTSAVLRRRPSGWELLVEARFDPAVGVQADRITVTVESDSIRSMVISRDGSVGTNGSDDREPIGIHQASDRWRVRIPLPMTWISRGGEAPARIGLAIERTIDCQGNALPQRARRQFAVVSPPLAHPVARRIPIDLSSWDLTSVTLAP